MTPGPRPMTALDAGELDRLEALAAEATPGPWFYNSYAGVFSAAFVQKAEEWPLDGDDVAEPDRYYEEADASVAGVPALRGDTAHGRHAADAAFIAACDPDTIRRLVAAAREPLDVERLAEAMHMVQNHIFDDSVGLHRAGNAHQLGDSLKAEAAQVAAEYAALRKPVTA